MMRFLVRRLCVFFIRLAIAATALVVFVEMGFGLLGGADRHVWSLVTAEPVPDLIVSETDSWWQLVQARVMKSLPVLLIAFSGVTLVGYGWGILAVRWRRIKAGWILLSPWAVLACLPAFWVVVMAAVYSYFVWERPGFGNEIYVESGPDLMKWWYALVVALPVMAPAASWLMRSVWVEVGKEATGPFVRGLIASGQSGEDVFYRNVVNRARGRLLRLLEKPLPFILGSLIVAEWAFRYEGVGHLIAESIRVGAYPGILLGGLAMAVFIGLVCLAREILEFLIERRVS